MRPPVGLAGLLVACSGPAPAPPAPEASVRLEASALAGPEALEIVLATRAGGAMDEISFPGGELRALVVRPAGGEAIEGCASVWRPTLAGGELRLRCPPVGAEVEELELRGTLLTLGPDGAELERLALPERVAVRRAR